MEIIYDSLYGITSQGCLLRRLERDQQRDSAQDPVPLCLLSLALL